MVVDDKLSPSLMPLPSLSRADAVEERLRAYFKEKALVPGDVLPKEIEIATALNVSRNVVREALSRFRMLGMIESKKRRGMILTEPDVLSGFERLLDPQMLGKETLKQLLEFRLVLEIGMADLLFLRRNEGDLQVLESIVDDEAEAQTEADRIDCDIRFHGKLYQMTGNETLRRFQKLLVPVFEYTIATEANLDGSGPFISSISHAGLLAILRYGDSASFREAMKKHLEQHFLFL